MKIEQGLPRAAQKGERVGLDLELYGADGKRLHRPTGAFAVASFAFSDGTVYQVEDTHDLKAAMAQVKHATLVMHNAMFDLFHLRRWVTVKQRPVWDTMVVEQDAFGGWYGTFALDDLARRWMNKRMDKSTVEHFFTATSMTQEMREYAARDALYALKLSGKQSDYLEEIADPLRCWHEVDQPAMWALLDMLPVRVNVEGWLVLGRTADQRAGEIRNRVGFNPGATKQCQEAIHTEYGIWPTYRKKATTAAEVLEDLRDKLLDRGRDATLLQDILDYRMYAKAASTYGENWVRDHVEDGDMVYSSWHLTGAETGRMSSSAPNLQNIPIRRMPEYRDQFISQFKNGRLLVADVSQQEPRITAWCSRDPRLLEAALTGDVYQLIADDLGITRDRAKAVFLGTTYGLTPAGLARREGISLDDATTFFDAFFSRYPGVERWMERQRHKAYSLCYVETPLGRRVWINPYQSQWANNALNGSIQGGAADMTKMAVGLIHQEAENQGIPFCLSLVVHDEVVLDVPPEYVSAYKEIVTEAWAEAGRKTIPDVPVKIDLRVGKTWGGKKK